MIKKILLIVVIASMSMLIACNDFKQVGQAVADESIKGAKQAAKNEIDQRINTAIDSIGIPLSQEQKDTIIKSLKDNPALITDTKEIKTIISVLITSIAKNNNISLTQAEIQKISNLAISYNNNAELATYITQLIIKSSINGI